MKREIRTLADGACDILIIGGGINGAACALDASLRGLKVALLERDDFGAATSANSAKIAHSGIRYLQHADFPRMRESIRERNLLIQNAPYLVRSQPVLFPTYGHGLKGKEVMSAYVRIYDLLSPERRRFKDPARRIPNATMLPKEKVLEIAPGLNPRNLTGAAVWQEGQIHNTERLVMAMLRTAERAGARIANYAEVTKLLVEDGAVTGVEAVDRQSGDRFAVRARLIINASGPWINRTLRLSGALDKSYVAGSKAFSLLTRSLSDTHVLSFSTRAMYEDKKALVDKGASIQFAIPWRGHSLIGSLHLPAGDDPEKVGISEEEIESYLAMINEGYPAAKLRRSDVKRVLWGMIPGEQSGSAAPEKHFRIIDHEQEDALEGLVSVAGVKLTTSRDVAERTIDLACRKLGRPAAPSRARATPLWGGDIEFIEDFRREAMTALSFLPESQARRLLDSYGTEHDAILRLAEGRPELLAPLPGSDVIRAEVVHAVEEEMALSLADVVLRRTDLGSLEYPGREALEACASLMAERLNWDEGRIAREIDEVTYCSGYGGRFSKLASAA